MELDAPDALPVVSHRLDGLDVHNPRWLVHASQQACWDVSRRRAVPQLRVPGWTDGWSRGLQMSREARDQRGSPNDHPYAVCAFRCRCRAPHRWS